MEFYLKPLNVTVPLNRNPLEDQDEPDPLEPHNVTHKYLTTVNKMLKVFVSYFPKHTSTKKVHQFLKHLQSWVEHKTNDEGVDSISTDEFTSKMEEISQKTGYDITDEVYIGCRGYRGPTNYYSGASYYYTSSYYCSLWTLWTLLTVQRYVCRNGQID